MPGHILQGKPLFNSVLDIPLVGNYDANGNKITDYYITKTERENIAEGINLLGEKADSLLHLLGYTTSSSAVVEEQ